MKESLLALPNSENLSLDQVMKLLAKNHDNQTVINLTRNWCMISKSDRIHRISMEFLYINGFYTDLQKMINKNKAKQNKETVEWASYYQLMLDRRLQKYSSRDVLNKIKNMRTDIPELKCLNEFIKILAYFNLNDFAQIGNFLDDQQSALHLIDDGLLISYFTVRTNQNLFIYHWTKNEVIIARKYAYHILNQIIDLKVKSSLHINLGLSYTFDTYSRAMYHLKEALRIATEQGFQDHIEVLKNNNIPFISANFKKIDGVSSQDKSEQAHLEVARGNHKKAVALLSESSEDDPFNLYYIGLAKQDEHYLFKSYNKFIEDHGDYFFARLPLNALKKMNQ